MSVEITPTAAPAPASSHTIEFQAYPHGVGVVIGGGIRTYFFPWRMIEGMHLEKKVAESGQPVWALTIQTAKERVNLSSSRNIEADYKNLCMNYRC